MATCTVCGNDYSKAFSITIDKQSFIFDCFECAIQKLAPTCSHCGCKIIGHGTEADDKYYCCAHCAHQAGINEMKDNANTRCYC